ncbi:MAG: 54S ribosomal protein L2 mitochondrial [Chrysothrix sp. TS-e1954]|nr:MAG: 54S ribosomal protein L2 mitochondrial [Chrysothrix sp. TS-e1954]
MLFQRTQAPQRAYRLLSRSPHTSSSILFPHPHPAPSARPPTHITTRHATHAAQGRANIQSKSHGKRLGAKKTGEQYVIPGNIIFRQRGTLWFPGENVARGRDHTIYATQSGYVKYYRDPRLHPKRQYIGVTFERGDSLPYPPNAARRRRFGMVASPRPEVGGAVVPESEAGEESTGGVDVAAAMESPASSPPAATTPPPPTTKAQRKRAATGRIDPNTLQLQSHSYAYRESNYSIGRIGERAGIVAPKFKPGDRFAAWRKREKRKEESKARRTLQRAARGPKASKRAGKAK